MNSVELGVAPSWSLRVSRPLLGQYNPPANRIRMAMLEAIEARGFLPDIPRHAPVNLFTSPLVLFNRDNFSHPAHPSIEAMSDRNEEIANALAEVLSKDIDNRPISCAPSFPYIRSMGGLGVTFFGVAYPAEQTFTDVQATSIHTIEGLAGEQLDMRSSTPYVILSAIEGAGEDTYNVITEAWDTVAPQGDTDAIPALDFGPVTIDYACRGNIESLFGKGRTGDRNLRAAPES